MTEVCCSHTKVLILRKIHTQDTHTSPRMECWPDHGFSTPGGKQRRGKERTEERKRGEKRAREERRGEEKERSGEEKRGEERRGEKRRERRNEETRNRHFKSLRHRVPLQVPQT